MSWLAGAWDNRPVRESSKEREGLAVVKVFCSREERPKEDPMACWLTVSRGRESDCLWNLSRLVRLRSPRSSLRSWLEPRQSIGD